MNVFKYQVKKQPGSGMTKNAKDKDIGVNPNRDADSSFSKSVHSNKTQNIFQNILTLWKLFLTHINFIGWLVIIY